CGVSARPRAGPAHQPERRAGPTEADAGQPSTRASPPPVSPPPSLDGGESLGGLVGSGISTPGPWDAGGSMGPGRGPCCGGIGLMMICPLLPPVPSPEPSWTGVPSAEVPPPGPPAAPSPTTVSGSVSPGGRVGRGRPGSGTCAGRSGGVGRVAGSFSGSSDVPPPDGEPSAGVSPSEGSPSEGVPVEGPSVAGVPVGVPSGVVPPVAPSSAPPGAVGDPGAAPSSVAPPPGACVADGAPVSWPAPIGARPVGESGRAGSSSAAPLAVVVVPAWSSPTAGTCTGAVVPSAVAGVAPAVPVPPELDGDPVVAASSCARPAAVPSPSSGSSSSVQVAAVPST